MKQVSFAGYAFSVKSLLLGFWLIVLSSLSLLNLAMIAENDQSTKGSEYDSQFQQIFAQLALYSERLESQQQDPAVKHSDLTNVQQELYGRIQAISEQLNQYALKKDVAELQNRIAANNERISKIETEISTLSIQIHSLKDTAQPKTKTVAKSNAVYSPPFKVLGAELRGGERMLVILPHSKKSIDDVQLISAGQRYGNWQLQSFNSKNAVFTVGNKTRRLAISR